MLTRKTDTNHAIEDVEDAKIELNQYELGEALTRVGPELVQRAIRRVDRQPILLKSVTDQDHNPEFVARLRDEWEMSRSVSGGTIVPALHFGNSEHGPMLVLEDPGGTTLDLRIQAGAVSIEEALSIACGLAAAVQSLHEKGIVHRSIEPRHVFYDQADNWVRLTGLGQASLLRSEIPEMSDVTHIGCRLAYLSPEQTGRMNCPVDRRADMYATGIVLFELLAGHLPFREADSLELLHAKIARQAPLLTDLRKDVPAPLAAIVARLLCKSPEDRYQTASGLLDDLTRCRDEYIASGSSASFEIGTSDISDELQFPARIYGRSEELAALRRAFSRSCQGATELVMIAGYSGVGKTALVRELYRTITEKGGYFISGKQDVYQQAIPYSALADALDALCTYLLSLDGSRLDQWRERIANAVGKNGQILVDICPRLTLVIGPQPKVDTVGIDEARNRFNLVFSAFISSVSDADHPLVIFLDDLQWADSGLLDMIEVLVDQASSQHLLLIGAYRTNEVGIGHPLERVLRRIGEHHTVESVELENLPPSALGEFVADTLATTSMRTAPLTELIMEKTGGNAFFTRQFLEVLHREQLLSLSSGGNAWEWQLEEIRGQDYSANVLDLMSARIGALPDLASQALRMAACIGGRFDVAMLSDATGTPWRELLTHLRPALEAGLLMPSSTAARRISPAGYAPSELIFEFLHDRIQEAAYCLIPQSKRTSVHLNISRLLLRTAVLDESDPRLFDIVHHLDRGAELIVEPAARAEAARLNEMAASRAFQSSAYGPAADFYRWGRQFLEKAEFSDDQERVLQHRIELGLARCDYLDGHLQEALLSIDKALVHARDTVQRLEVLRLKSMVETQSPDIQAARNTIWAALSEVGFGMPETPALCLAAIDEELRDAALPSSLEEIAAVIDLPMTSDKRMAACIDLLVNAHLPMMQNQEIEAANLVIVRALVESFRHGGSSCSGLAMAYFGAFIGASTGDYKRAAQWGEAAMRFMDRQSDQSLRARTLFTYGVWVSHLGLPARKTVDLQDQVYRSGVESGDLLYAGFSVANRVTNAVLCGFTVPELSTLCSEERARGQRVHYVDDELFFEPLTYALRSMGSGSQRASDWSIDGFDEAAHWRRLDDELAILNVWIGPIKVMLLVVDGRYTEALSFAQHVAGITPVLATIFPVVSFHFYHCLAILLERRVHGTAPEDEEYLAELITGIEHRARACPANFEHQILLIRALQADTEGHVALAMDLYDQAIAAARETEYLNVEALAYELAARFWLRQGRPSFALPYLRDARAAYARWGVATKTDDLREEAQTLENVERRTADSASWEETPVDQLAVLKAARLISGELDPDLLLSAMARVVAEAAGAQRAVVVLAEEEGIAASWDLSPIAEPLDTTGTQKRTIGHPASFIRYVRRIRRAVRLDDAAKEGMFTADPYFVERQTRSAWCIPLRRGDRQLGVVYLENDLAPRSFAPELEPVLELLMAQAAISLESALLFHEQKESEFNLSEAQRIAEIGSFSGTVARDELRWSDELFRIHGKDPQEFQPTKQTFVNLIHPDDRDAYLLLLECSLTTGAPLNSDYRITTEDGSIRTLHTVAMATRDDDGQIVGLRGTVQDVTENRRAEEEREELVLHLRQVEKMEVVGQLAGGVAHDFNNLLTVILGNAELLLCDLEQNAIASVDTFRSGLEQIQVAGESAATVTRQLLSFARRSLANTEVLDPSQVIKKTESMLRRLLREDIAFDVSIEPNTCSIHADAGQLEQIVLNLVVNARDAMPEGGRLGLSCSNVEVGTGDKGPGTNLKPGLYCKLTVTDTGEGMSKQTSARIFEPFFTTKPSGLGTGLGLATVHGIVTTMNAHIEVESELGRGSTFDIYIPAHDVLPAVPEQETLAGGSGGPAVVLVCEDDQLVRDLVCQFLESSEYEVLNAENGAHALEVATEFGGNIDLLVTDVIMPVMNGRELSDEMSRRYPDLGILYISGYAADVIDAEIVEMAGRGLLQKPFDRSSLLHRVRQILNEAGV